MERILPWMLAILLFSGLALAQSQPDDPSAVDIWTAASQGNTEVVKQHVSAGTDIDALNPEWGLTALHMTALYDKLDVAAILIRAGAQVNVRGRDGSSLLHTAGFFGRTELVKLLLENGADTGIRDQNWKTPIDNAASPWDPGLEGVYRRIGRDLNIKLDSRRIKAARPKIVALLRQHGDTAAGHETGDPSYIAKGEHEGPYWPTDGWKTCRPEAVGMNSQKLADALRYARDPAYHTKGLLVVKNGYIIAEGYSGGYRKDDMHVSNSMAKSFTSALIGIAIGRGAIPGVDERVCKYYEEWDCDDKDDLRSRITIRHALTLTTGLEWHEDWSKWDFNTNDALKMGASRRSMEYMAGRKGRHEPGKRFIYSTGDPMLLSRVIHEATGMSAFEFAKKHLFGPLNMSKVYWDKGLDGYTVTCSSLHTTVREFAKFGYLFLNRGTWDGRQIVPEAWVDTSTRTDPSVRMWSGYAYLWHINFPMRFRGRGSKIPADGFMAEGVRGQNIIIFPSQDLVIVKVANSGSQHRDPDLSQFLTMVLESVES